MSDRLPAELWRLIFREATYVADLKLFTVEWDYSAAERLWGGWESVDKAVSVASDPGSIEMSTKQAITLVSRTWRTIGSEFLYESLSIPQDASNFNFNMLIATFRTSACGPEPRSGPLLGYGWWTERIVYRKDSRDFNELLFALLDECHSLETFCIGRWGADGGSSEKQIRLAHVLESRFRHSLRRVGLNTSSAPSDSHSPFRTVIPCIDRLRSLSISVTNDTSNTPHQTFDHVTSLKISLPSYLDIFPSLWSFPLLRNLSLCGVATRDIDAIVPFIKRHATTLVHLHILNSSHPNTRLPFLLSEAPQLLSLTLDDSNMGSIARLPILTHVSLEGAGDNFETVTRFDVNWKTDYFPV